MKYILQQLRYQLKVFLRDKTHWVMPVLSLVLLVTNVGYKDKNILSIIYINYNASHIFLYLSIVYGAMCTRFFLLEVNEDHQIQWSRPLTRQGFVLVKYLSSLIGIATFLLPSLILLVLRGVPFNNTANLLHGIGHWFYLFVPTFSFVTAFSILVGLVIPKMALAVGVTLVGLVGAGMRTVSWPDMLKYVPYRSYSLVFGFGPEREVMQFNRVFFIAVSAMILFLTIILAHWRLPSNKGEIRTKPAVAVLTLLIAAMVATSLSGSQLNHIGKFLITKPDLVTYHKQPDHCQALKKYRVRLEIDRNGMIVRAVASIQLDSDVDPGKQILLLESLAENGIEIQEISRGVYEISYSGKFIVPNYAYSELVQEARIASVGYLPGGFLDQGKVLLLSRGQWHPFSRCDMTSLGLTIPKTFRINYSSATSSRESADSTTLTWDHPLPAVLLIAGGNYDETELNGNKALIPSHSDMLRIETYRAYQERLRFFWQIIHGEGSDIPKIVSLPIMRQSILDQRDIFFLQTVPVTITMPWSPPETLEIEGMLEIVQAWWTQGKNDSTLAFCIYRGLGCEGFDEVPEDKGILPFLYYMSIKLAGERMPSLVEADKIIQDYQDLETDPALVFSVPRYFMDGIGNAAITQYARLDRCLGSDAYWEMVKALRDRSDGIWMSSEAIAEAIEASTGLDLGNLAAQCPAK